MLKTEGGIDFLSVDEQSEEGREILSVIKGEAVERLGYFLNPSELFSSIAKSGAHQPENNGNDSVVIDNFILADLAKVLSNIEQHKQ